MGKVTIYLKKDIEKMVSAAQSAHLSKSKWIAKLIQDKVANEWSQSVIDSDGSWNEFPDLNEIKSSTGKDIPREPF